MKWSLFFCLLLFPTLSHADLCPSTFIPITGPECTEDRLGCNISNAPCSSTNGCNTRTVKGTTKPGGIRSFCIDPGKDINFLKIETKVDDGCGTARTQVRTADGYDVSNSTGNLTLTTSTLLKRPVTIDVIGEVRPEDFGGGFIPGGGGGDVSGPTCDPPTVPR